MLNHRQSTGKLGETIAATYLQKKGYHIIERNFRARYGEIDIIAEKGKTLVFVEVKTRIGTAFGTPEEAVTPRKLREVYETTQYYVDVHAYASRQQRIDLIAIALEEDQTVVYIHHLENISG